MIDDNEVNKIIEMFKKKSKKKVYAISALKHLGLKTLRKILISHAH